jgi:putative DNA primase/helicase
LIPFTQRFEDGKGADTDLPDKLRAEHAGVLAWAMRGCMEWMEHGLGSSTAVERATAAYRAETDVIDRFFADECVFGPEYSIPKKELFEAWEGWCEGEGEDAGSQVRFTRVMSEKGALKGFAETKYCGTRVWRGVSTVPNPPHEPNLPHEKDLQTGGGKRECGAGFL